MSSPGLCLWWETMRIERLVMAMGSAGRISAFFVRSISYRLTGIDMRQLGAEVSGLEADIRAELELEDARRAQLELEEARRLREHDYHSDDDY